MVEVLALSPSLKKSLKVGSTCVPGMTLKAADASDLIGAVQDAVDQLDHVSLNDRISLPPTTTQTLRANDEDFAEFRKAETVGDDSIHAAVPLASKEAGAEIDIEKRFVSPKDFDLLKVIGMGAFGKVLQVRNRKSHTIHAMKIISKRLLRRKTGYIENIVTEQAIMARVRHPFVVTMHCSFQTREKLFLVMDFLAGGELFLRLGREGIFLEKTASFYLAEIILALDHLHGLGILHRDLKPENILLGADGHVCLTDFGLAKDFGVGLNDDEENQRANTICGTQEYMAPEMIARKGYGRAADYWSLGCIAYEMLNGLPPFDSKQGAKELFRKIMSEKVKMPNLATAAACKLLKGLLNRDVQKRWGTTKNTMFEVGGVAFLKQAEFFKDVDWIKLEKKEIEPPAVFSVENEEDLQYFHNEFTSMALPRSVVEMSGDSYRPHRVHSETFRGFSFIQADYTIPDRDLAEIQKYFYSVDEDGQSVSDCASSKLDHQEVPVLASPEVKKRPPRKRKKKVVSTDNTPAASAATSPMASATATPTPSECGEPLVDSSAPIGPAVPSSIDRFPSLLDPPVSKQPVSIPSSPSPVEVPNPSMQQEPRKNAIRGPQQTVAAHIVPKRDVVNAQPSHKPNDVLVAGSKTCDTGQGIHRTIWNSGTAKATPATLRSKIPTANKSAQGPVFQASIGLGQPLPHSHQQWPQQSTRSTGKMPSNTSTTSSHSQAHNYASHSDWRQHTMSPHSPRSIRRPKNIDLDAPMWPSLCNDPPLPSSKPAPSKPSVQGAWATRSKR